MIAKIKNLNCFKRDTSDQKFDVNEKSKQKAREEGMYQETGHEDRQLKKGKIQAKKVEK